MLDASKQVPIVWKGTPFSGAVGSGTRPEGMTILEIVKSLDALPPWFMQAGIVCIDGHEVPRHWWPRVRPRARLDREVIVTLHIRLTDGDGEGGGGKNVVATVAALAVIAVATFVSGGGLAPVLGPSFAAGQFGALFAATAISTAGALAVSALSPPPRLGSATGAAVQSDIEAEDRGTASLQGNALQPGGSIPRVVGTHRVFPPLGSPPLNEIVGTDEFVEAIFVLAGPHELNDIRIGDTPIDEIEEVQVETRQGLGGESDIGLVNRQSKTENVAIELSQHKFKSTSGTQLEDQGNPENSIPNWHSTVSRVSPDEIWLPIFFPQGHFDTTVPTTNRATPFRIRIRQLGETTWINLPEVHIQSNATTPLVIALKLMWQTAPTVLPQPETDEAPYLAFWQTIAQTAGSGPSAAKWVSHAHFDAGSGDDYLNASNVATTRLQNTALYNDRVEFYLDEATFPKGTYEIQIKQGAIYSSPSFAPSSYSIGGVYDFFWYWFDGSNNNTPASQNLKNHNYEAVAPRLSSIWNEHPIQDNALAQIAIRVHNRQLDRLSVLASGLVEDYNASTGEWDNLTTTSNPAAHYRDILTGALTVDPLPDALIDDATLIAWRSHCDTQGYQVNAVIEGQTALDAMLLVASAGFARPRQSETWDVMQDKDRSAEAHVQMFTPRNMRGFRWQKSFGPLPDGFRVRYNDSTRNYRENEFIVFNPNTPGGGPKLEDIKYDGLVTQAEATARAKHDLRQASLRAATYFGEVDLQGLRVRRGDLIGVQNDVIDRNGGSARIKAVYTDGAATPKLTALDLDGTIPNDERGFFTEEGDDDFFTEAGTDDFFLNPSLGITIRDSEGNFVTKLVTGDEPVETHRVTFDTPFASSTIGAGNLIASGRFNTEFHRMIVLDIKNSKDVTAQLVMVPEAPELFS